MAKRGTISLTYEHLERALGIPLDVAITNLWVDPESHYVKIEVCNKSIHDEERLVDVVMPVGMELPIRILEVTEGSIPPTAFPVVLRARDPY